MQGAPAVIYPVGRSPFMGGALLALWLLGAAVLAGWWVLAAGPDWRHALGAAACAATGASAASGWWRSPRGELEWDGASWHFASCEASTPRVALDVQHGLLLQLRVEGRGVWLWASRAAAPSYWEALRRAVYCRAGPASPQAMRPPPASS